MTLSINRNTAKKIILDYLNSPQTIKNIKDNLFVIQSLKLSSKSDYWIIRANSEAYVKYRGSSKCYVGVNAYLVNTHTGQIEIVTSAQIDKYLQDKYDERDSNGKFYVLGSGYKDKNKLAIIKLPELYGYLFWQDIEKTMSSRI